jgi:hypothetical protein
LSAGFTTAFAVRAGAVVFLAPGFEAAVFELVLTEAAGFCGLAAPVAFEVVLSLFADVFAFSFALSNSAVERGFGAGFFFIAGILDSVFCGEDGRSEASSFGV